MPRCNKCKKRSKLFIAGNCWDCSYLADEVRGEEMKQRTESVSKEQVPMDVYRTSKTATGDRKSRESDTFSREMKDDLQEKITKAIDGVKFPTRDAILYAIARVIRDLK